MPAVMWFLACADPPTTVPDAVDSPTYHADVAPILAARCVGCHDVGGIGTFRLTTFSEAAEVAELVAAATESRRMPPWRAAPGHVAYLNDPSLTEDQIATIRAWVDAGAPEGDASDAPDPLPSLVTSLPRVDRTLAMATAYQPATEPDDHRCFALEWPGDELQYLTGFEVRPGNRSVVHHVAAFLVRPDGPLGAEAVDRVTGWDGSDGAPGYTCFGGPTLTGAPDGVPAQQVAQWVPGSGATVFPAGVGIPIPGGSAIVLQLHYNTASSDGAPDQSEVDWMLEPDVPRIGAFTPWLDFGWPDGGMDLPPGVVTSHTASGDPLPAFSGMVPDADLSAGFELHAILLHMHRLGRSGIVRVDRAAGRQILLEVPEWDFDWQLTYALVEPVRFDPGDALFLKCTFDNSTAETVGWGESSDQEMCVANLFVSAPR